MSGSLWRVEPVPLPGASRIAGIYADVQLADAYRIRLPSGTTSDPEELARFVFGRQAVWVRMLMGLRDLLVGFWGIKTARQLSRAPRPAGATGSDSGSGSGRVGIFRIYEKCADEILLGENDRHLDFRVSLLREPAGAPAADTAFLTLSTVVHCHGIFGRLYILVIAPFHRLVVRHYLSRAARDGWPGAVRT